MFYDWLIVYALVVRLILEMQRTFYVLTQVEPR
jgi:hypothetical protein